jgi:hypothetical protein
MSLSFFEIPFPWLHENTLMNVATDQPACNLARRCRAVAAGRFGITARSRLAVALTLGIFAALGLANSCRAAGLVISAPAITASAGSSGSFLVLITDTDPAGSTPYNVAGDSFELTLTGPASIMFTGATTATDVSPFNTPYIYAHSIDNDYSIPLYTAPTIPFPTTDFMAADSYDFGYSPGYTMLNPGDVYALGLVSYTISPTATPGSVDTIGFVAATTGLTDNNLPPNPIPSTTMNGSIMIASSVPEPSTWAMAMIAIGLGPLVFGSRRRRSNSMHRPR